MHRICRVLERVTIRWIVSKEQGGYCCSGSMINLGGFEGKNIEKIISRLGFFLKWPWFPCYEHHETTIYAFYFRMVTFNIWSPTKKQSTLNLKKNNKLSKSMSFNFQDHCVLLGSWGKWYFLPRISGFLTIGIPSVKRLNVTYLFIILLF